VIPQLKPGEFLVSGESSVHIFGGFQTAPGSNAGDFVAGSVDWGHPERKDRVVVDPFQQLVGIQSQSV
jgi:hypothetical protein